MPHQQRKPNKIIQQHIFLASALHNWLLAVQLNDLTSTIFFGFSLLVSRSELGLFFNLLIFKGTNIFLTSPAKAEKICFETSLCLTPIIIHLTNQTHFKSRKFYKSTPDWLTVTESSQSQSEEDNSSKSNQGNNPWFFFSSCGRGCGEMRFVSYVVGFKELLSRQFVSVIISRNYLGTESVNLTDSDWLLGTASLLLRIQLWWSHFMLWFVLSTFAILLHISHSTNLINCTKSKHFDTKILRLTINKISLTCEAFISSCWILTTITNSLKFQMNGR